MFLTGDGIEHNSFKSLPAALQSVLAFCLRESTSSVITEKGPIGGNASDRAVLSFLDKSALLEKADASIIKEILFNSSRKYSAAQIAIGKSKKSPFNSSEITLVKGAPGL